jgi:hypothetical protein
MWFWAGFYVSAFYGNVSPESRGPTGAEGILWHDSIRSEAWELRTYTETAFISPDGTPEKAYFTQLISDAISEEEGARNITTTANDGSVIWNRGRNVFAPSDSSETSFPGPLEGGSFAAGTVTPLHQWSQGSPGLAANSYGICGPTMDGNGSPEQTCAAQTVNAGTQLFETDYLLYSLGRANEMGYASGALLAWLGSSYTAMLTTPGYNPYLIDAGQIPVVNTAGQYFPNYPSTMVGFSPARAAYTTLKTNGDPDGYAAYVISGLSYLTGQPNGTAAWEFMAGGGGVTPAYNWSAFSTLPKWALLPRGAVLPQVSSCDLNNDGSVDAADVQSAINQALGTTACTGDLVGTGTCTVVDVQRVINASLGGICRLGQ